MTKEELIKEIESHDFADEIFDIQGYMSLKAVRVESVDTRKLTLSGLESYIDEVQGYAYGIAKEYGKEVAVDIFTQIKRLQDADRAHLANTYGPDALNWDPSRVGG